MENLSIVIKDNIEENIYNAIKILSPLLDDGNTQLILINNIKTIFQIKYNHIIYEFEEEYEKFYEFCEASSFNNNLLIIEDGVVLTNQLVEEVRGFLLKYKNINIEADFKKYYCKDTYYIEKKTLVYNTRTLEKERISIEIDDFTYSSNLGINLKHNISRFIRDRKFKELYLWYKDYIMVDADVKYNFYNYIEKFKVDFQSNIIDSINRNFLVENVEIKYCEYLRLMKMLKENNVQKDYLKNVVEKNKFTEKNSYFSYFIFECFKKKKLINSVFAVIGKKTIELYIKNLFREYKDFDFYIYEFLVTIDIEAELKISNNENVLIYMELIENFYKNTSASFMDKDKKEKLIKLLIDYSKYGLYSIENNLTLDERTKKVISKLVDVKNLIESNKMKTAVDILFESGESWDVITLPARYYAQKIIYENKIHSSVFSITMIVKNEERNLERCLKSLTPLLENQLAELIIVDTGSEDKTVGIAKKYTDRIYFHPWQGNFSEARNWSISLAKGEYIFIIDADNEFDRTEIYKYIKFFRGKEYKQFNSFSFKLKNYEDENNTKFSIINQNNIFKNDGTFHYSGTVHNQPNFNNPVKNLDIIVHHYGYIMNSKEARERKFSRTGYILKKELEKKPLSLYYRYQLTKTYSLYGDHKESLNQTKLFMKILNNEPVNYNYIVYYNAASIVYLSNKLYDEAIKICDDILSINPHFIDSLYFKAISLYFKEDYRECIIYYKMYLHSLESIHKTSIINDIRLEFYSIDSKELAETDIMISYLKLQDYLQCIEYIFTKEKNKVVKYQFGVVKSYISLNKFKELAMFYKLYVHPASENDRFDFSQYIRNEIESLGNNELRILSDEFSKLNIKDKGFYLLKKSVDKREKNSLKNIIRFLAKHDMESVNIMMLERAICDAIVILINNEDSCLTLDEIIDIRKIIKDILIQILNKKSINGLNKEQILPIIFKYMDYGFLVYENSKQNLNKKEILFLENIILAFQHMKNKDLISAVRAIKNASLEDEDMANAMAIYVETIIRI